MEVIVRLMNEKTGGLLWSWRKSIIGSGKSKFKGPEEWTSWHICWFHLLLDLLPEIFLCLLPLVIPGTLGSGFSSCRSRDTHLSNCGARDTHLSNIQLGLCDFSAQNCLGFLCTAVHHQPSQAVIHFDCDGNITPCSCMRWQP